MKKTLSLIALMGLLSTPSDAIKSADTLKKEREIEQNICNSMAAKYIKLRALLDTVGNENDSVTIMIEMKKIEKDYQKKCVAKDYIDSIDLK